jgi:hypothetical protein
MSERALAGVSLLSSLEQAGDHLLEVPGRDLAGTAAAAGELRESNR